MLQNELVHQALILLQDKVHTQLKFAELVMFRESVMNQRFPILQSDINKLEADIARYTFPLLFSIFE